MEKERIKKNIEELKEAKFYNQMVDRWTDYHYERDRQLREQIRELEKMLEECDESTL